MRRALLYDIHGNLVALDAVLDDAREAGAEGFVLGGDYALFGAWPAETLARLETLPSTTWIRGNTERYLVEDPKWTEGLDALEFVRAALEHQIQRLYSLPTEARLDGVLFCHASPLAHDETFGPAPADEEERLLGPVREGTVVFGHSHVQFLRPGSDGVTLVNPGSVGLPMDGDTRAAWALLHPSGEIELRRTSYDVARAAAAVRPHGAWGAQFATALETATRF